MIRHSVATVISVFLLASILATSAAANEALASGGGLCPDCVAPTPPPPPPCLDTPDLPWRCIHATAMELAQAGELLESVCREIKAIVPFRTQKATDGAFYVYDYVILTRDIDGCVPPSMGVSRRP